MENDIFINNVEVMLKSFAESSRPTYLSELNLFSEFLGDKPLSKADEFDAFEYLKHIHARTIRGKPLANKTIKRKIDSLVSMYDSALDFRGVEANPFIRVVRHTRRLKLILKREPVALPFDKVKSIVGSALSPRDRALLAILIGGGLRNTEVRLLERSDVKFLDNGSVGIAVRCALKRGKPRPVTLPDWASEHLMEYLNFSVPLRYIFSSIVAGEERPLSRKIVSDICYSHIGHRSHACRHTLVSYLLSIGTPLPDVARAVGHKHITSTMIYDSRLLEFKSCAAQKAKYDQNL